MMASNSTVQARIEKKWSLCNDLHTRKFIYNEGDAIATFGVYAMTDTFIRLDYDEDNRLIPFSVLFHEFSGIPMNVYSRWCSAILSSPGPKHYNTVLAHINALPLIKDCLEVARGDNSSIYGNGMVISVRVLYCILRICKDCNREICDYVIAASGTEDVDLPPGSTIPPENYNIRFLIDVASSESTSIEDLDFRQIAVSDFLLVNKILAGSKLNHGKYYLYTQVCAATMSVTAT